VNILEEYSPRSNRTISATALFQKSQKTAKNTQLWRLRQKFAQVAMLSFENFTNFRRCDKNRPFTSIRTLSAAIIILENIKLNQNRRLRHLSEKVGSFFKVLHAKPCSLTLEAPGMREPGNFAGAALRVAGAALRVSFVMGVVPV